jgi:hypothetical protein
MLSLHSWAYNVFSYFTYILLVLSLFLSPVSASEQMIHTHKGLIDVGYIKNKIMSYIEQAYKFDEKTKVKDIRKYIKSFVNFANMFGCDMTTQDLYYRIERKLKKRHPDMNFSVLKVFFLNSKEIERDEYFKNLTLEQKKEIAQTAIKLFSKQISHKSLQSDIKEDLSAVEVEVDGCLVIGGVLMASSVLVGAIGIALPFISPFTTGLAWSLFGAGTGLVAQGVCNTASNRQNSY